MKSSITTLFQFPHIQNHIDSFQFYQIYFYHGIFNKTVIFISDNQRDNRWIFCY